MGNPVGRLDGSADGTPDGSPLGIFEGAAEGLDEGTTDGDVGRADGANDGEVGADEVGTLVGKSILGSLQSYPFEPQLATAAGFVFAKQLDMQQSPRSHPHCFVFATPILQTPFPSTKGLAVQVIVGPLVG